MEAIGKATGVVPVAKEQDTEVDFVIIGAGTQYAHEAPSTVSWTWQLWKYSRD